MPYFLWYLAKVPWMTCVMKNVFPGSLVYHENSLSVTIEHQGGKQLCRHNHAFFCYQLEIRDVVIFSSSRIERNQKWKMGEKLQKAENQSYILCQIRIENDSRDSQSCQSCKFVSLLVKCSVCNWNSLSISQKMKGLSERR